ncbi:hypothetical protein OG244_06070 [Streptomyces brevispora]|uniref:hypothetical protein n=1 Tax=Streptomyces brevispora TaxID=887462 RepID=UPI002E31C082|nr:hypothetical protein [Streptomyces brevispora]
MFRWVLALGLVLIGCSMGVHFAAPGFPEVRQVDLTVLDEAPDGACTVRWTDPFEQRDREGPYRCDADRDPALKAPGFDGGSGLGWDSAFMTTEGADGGDLYVPLQDSRAAGPAARVDFDARSAQYCHVLEGVTGHGIVPVT